MNNIAIEEIREALDECKGECNEVQSKVSDVKDATSDVSSYADDADTAAYEAEEKVKRAIDLLDGWQEDQEEAIDPERVKEFDQNTLNAVEQAQSMITAIKTNCEQFAREHSFELKGL